MSTALLSALGSEDMPLYVVCTFLYLQDLCHIRGGPFREEAETCGYTRMTFGSMPLRPIVIEYQLLLLRRFHSTRDIASNPLVRLSTRKTQAPFRSVRCKQSSTPNAR